LIERLQPDARQKVTLPCERKNKAPKYIDAPTTDVSMSALWFADFIRAEPKESEPGFLLDGVRRGAQYLELHLEPVLGLELEMELLFSPTSSLVLSASFDSARLVGQIRLTAVGGTIEISRPMWAIAIKTGTGWGLLWESLRYCSYLISIDLDP
jgi:hypothetical protein